MTTRVILLIALPTALAVGCTGLDANCSGDACECAGEDCGDDTSVSEFDATIVATTPFEGVVVSVDGDYAECNEVTCTYQVQTPGEYKVEAEDSYTFVPKTVLVEEPGEIQVNWAEGGCLSDPEWYGNGECAEWEPGEYGFTPLEGSYTDEIWGAGANIDVEVSDDEIVLVSIFAGANGVIGGGNAFYASNASSGAWMAGTVIDNTSFSMHFLDAFGTDADYLFNLDD